MGQFANTLFSGLLGWVRTAAAGLWSLITNAETSAWFRWLLDNWLPLILLLCLGGALIDFIVYLIRWQPYRMWGKFLHRQKRKDTPDAARREPPAMSRKWLYADGTVLEDGMQDVLKPLQPLPEEKLESLVRPMRRVARRTTPEQSYHQPYYPPQWQRTNEQGEQ